MLGYTVFNKSSGNGSGAQIEREYTIMSTETVRTFTCTTCKTVDIKMNEFPKGRCLECHAKATEHEVYTAKDIRNMWGIK